MGYVGEGLCQRHSLGETLPFYRAGLRPAPTLEQKIECIRQPPNVLHIHLQHKHHPNTFM